MRAQQKEEQASKEAISMMTTATSYMRESFLLQLVFVSSCFTANGYSYGEKTAEEVEWFS